MREIEPPVGHTIDMEGKPIPFGMRSITSDRVNHYSDIIDFLVNTELARCANEKIIPTANQIEFFRKELTRLVTIRGELDRAQRLRIPKSDILNETNSLYTRFELQP